MNAVRASTQRGHFQLNLTSLGVQLSFIMTGSAVNSRLGSFIPSGTAKLIRLGVEHVVERFFNRAANHLTEMIPDLCLINFDDFVQVPVFFVELLFCMIVSFL